MQVISFPAQVYKVQTLADGGVRVTLDLPETTIPEMAMLAECQRFGVMLRVNAEPQEEPVKQERTEDAEMGKGPVRKSGWQTKKE